VRTWPWSWRRTCCGVGPRPSRSLRPYHQRQLFHPQPRRCVALVHCGVSLWLTPHLGYASRCLTGVPASSASSHCRRLYRQFPESTLRLCDGSPSPASVISSLLRPAIAIDQRVALPLASFLSYTRPSTIINLSALMLYDESDNVLRVSRDVQLLEILD